MKRALLITVIVCLTKVTVFAGNDNIKHVNWFIDSYKYGRSGRNCSDIYYNYGTDKWTFNSDDPALLKKLHESCRTGEKDKESGDNNLPRILDAYKGGD